MDHNHMQMADEHIKHGPATAAGGHDNGLEAPLVAALNKKLTSL